MLGGARGGPGVGIQPRHERRLELPVKGQVEDRLERAARRRVRRQPGDELIRHGAPGRVRRGGDGVPGADERLGGEAALQPNGDAELRFHRRVSHVAVRAARRRVTCTPDADRSIRMRQVPALEPRGDVAPPRPGDGERIRRLSPRRERRDEPEWQTGVRSAREQGARQLERRAARVVVEQRRATRLDEEPRVQADVRREPRGGAVGGQAGVEEVVEEEALLGDEGGGRGAPVPEHPLRSLRRGLERVRRRVHAHAREQIVEEEAAAVGVGR